MGDRVDATSWTMTDPGIVDLEGLCRLVARHSYCSLPSQVVSAILGWVTDLQPGWQDFVESWGRLPLDGFMADGGRYRRRRHAALSSDHATRRLVLEPHQPHYQSLAYNSLNGGVARYYEPIEPSVMNGAPMRSLLALGHELFSRMSPYSDWFIEVTSSVSKPILAMWPCRPRRELTATESVS